MKQDAGGENKKGFFFLCHFMHSQNIDELLGRINFYIHVTSWPSMFSLGHQEHWYLGSGLFQASVSVCDSVCHSFAIKFRESSIKEEKTIR